MRVLLALAVAVLGCKPPTAPPAPPPPKEAPPPDAGPPPDMGPKREFYREAPELKPVLERDGIRKRSEWWEEDLGVVSHCYSVEAADDKGETAAQFITILKQIGFRVDPTTMDGERGGDSSIVLLGPGTSILILCHEHEETAGQAEIEAFMDTVVLHPLREFIESNPARVVTIHLDWDVEAGVSGKASGTFDGTKIADVRAWLEREGYAVTQEDAKFGVRRELERGSQGAARIGKLRDDWDLETPAIRAALPWAE